MVAHLEGGHHAKRVTAPTKSCLVPAMPGKVVDFLTRNEQRETSNEKRGTSMPKTIQWEKDKDTALTRARKEKKMVLLDFFNPG